MFQGKSCALIVVLFAATSVGFFLFGAYSHSKNTKPIQLIREALLERAGKPQTVGSTPTETQALRAKHAQTARTQLIEESGFNRSYLGIWAQLASDNSLRYLYSDIDFIFEKDSKFCPNADLTFFTRFSQYAQKCMRIAYENTEYQTYGVLIQAAAGKQTKDLLIYNHGHGGTPALEHSWADELLHNVLERGSDVLLVSMPYTGLDIVDNEITTKTWDGWATFNPEALGQSHATFELFDTGDSHFIRYFIDNAVVSTIALRKQYRNIRYLGLSGGATVGLYTCAVLKNILDNCVLVAGVMPAHLRLNNKSMGDAEQISASLLKGNTVVDIIREISTSKTKLTLGYNSQDQCCFSNPWAQKFSDELKQQSLKSVNVFIRDSAVHGYDPSTIVKVLYPAP